MSEGLGFGKRGLIKKIISNNWNLKNPELKKFSYNELLFVIQEMLQEEGKAYHELSNPNINMGHHKFREFVKYLLFRNIANYDSMVLLTSEKGTGKSSVGIMIAREWCRQLGIRFDPARHIAYSNADVMNKIEKLNKFEPILCDEAIRFASAAEWNKKDNQQLKKKLAEVRTKHLLYILCFPLKIYKLEKNYLESYVNYWIDLFDRGKGALYVKDKNPYKGTWGLEHFKKLGSYTEFSNVNKIEKILKKHPNFWQIIRFPKPPKWLYDRYLKVREKNVYDDENVLKNVSKQDIHNALLVLALRDIMMNDQVLSPNRIILHIKNEYDVNITKGMVQAAIEDAKQLVNKIREEALLS